MGPGRWALVRIKKPIADSDGSLRPAPSQPIAHTPKRKTPRRCRTAGLLPSNLELGRLPATATTTTAATATATAGARTATAATTTASAFLRFIDAQWATAHVLAIERLDSALCVSTRHFDETEAARTTGFTVVDQRNRFHRAVLLEQRTHLSVVC
jgi:hypothetical protein